MDPSYQRQKKAERLIRQSNVKINNIIERNLKAFPVNTNHLGDEAKVKPLLDTDKDTLTTGMNKNTAVNTSKGVAKLAVRKNEITRSKGKLAVISEEPT